MTKPKDAGDRLSALMNALAEQAASATDNELLDDAVAEGIEVKAEATRVRELLLDAILRAKKERLRQAQKAHRQAVADIGARATRLPDDPAARRTLLMRTLQHRPQMREAAVTLQHRNFESFSDADVESALHQFDALGLLDGDRDPKP